MTLQEIVIILSRPSEPGNIGAACRAMKNMGLFQLRLVSPDPEPDDGTVRARAIHAQDVWEGAERYASLEDAAADCSIVVGTTRRRGKKRKDVTLTPGELARFLKEKPGKAAIVFGNERTGLDSDELKLCHIASHIPADDSFPSLNLSHAVQIYTYELRCALGLEGGGRWVPINADRIDAVVESMTNSLQEIGFYVQTGRDEQTEFFKSILARSGLTLGEARYLERIFTKITHLKGGAARMPT
jgi:tRNA/rRNA methyltransferase/tRNA (cytidine32/uridine32-2'-O)-methyltransferase